MTEEIRTEPSKTIENALRLPKVDSFLSMRFAMDFKDGGFDPNTSKVGLIATVESEEVNLENTLSRSGRVLAVLTPYSKIPSIVNNSKVLSLEPCDEDIIDILRSAESDEVTLITPWPIPVSDEWDSPSYDSFWHPVEQAFQRKIETLERVGKKVKIIPREVPQT